MKAPMPTSETPSPAIAATPRHRATATTSTAKTAASTAIGGPRTKSTKTWAVLAAPSASVTGSRITTSTSPGSISGSCSGGTRTAVVSPSGLRALTWPSAAAAGPTASTSTRA